MNIRNHNDQDFRETPNATPATRFSGVGAPLSGSLLALLALVPGVPPAQAQTCNSLYSLAVAETNPTIPDCQTTLAVAGHICDGKTSDQCLVDLYDDPNTLSPPPATDPGGEMQYKFLSKCEDGTDTCGSSEEVRCLDGTRPMIHVDKAVDVNGDDMYSDDWVFYVAGGGSCYDGHTCWKRYSGGEKSEMSTAYGGAKNKVQLDVFGLLSDDPDGPNDFRHFNRVRLYKCTFDRFAGNRTRTAESIPQLPGATADLFFHGARMWEAVFNFLKTDEGRDLDSDGVIESGDGEPDLPLLTNATHILVASWSGGGTGMAHQADRFAEMLTSPAADDVDGDGDADGIGATGAAVKMVLDGRFPPMIETEFAFTDRVDNSIYDHVTTAGTLPDNPGDCDTVNAYSDGNFRANGHMYEANNGMGVTLDASCVWAHISDTTMCHDPIHVWTNHVTVPFFIRMGLRDTAYTGTAPQYADNPSCYEWLASDFKPRVAKQTKDYLDEFDTDSELASGSDPDGGVRCTNPVRMEPYCWERGVFVPNQGGADSHDGLEDADQFGTGANPVELVKCVDSNFNGTYELEVARWNTTTALHRWLIYDVYYDALEGREGRDATGDYKWLGGSCQQGP